jgi:RNA polymerase sigma factor (sigma-70 family)
MDRRLARREDPEDVVQSALKSFFRGMHDRRFRIDHTSMLWALLERITMNKLLKHKERATAGKRTPLKEACTDPARLYARDPSPQEAIVVADLIEAVISGLESPYPEILRMRLEGGTEVEIAETLKCGRQAVHYKLCRLRDRLQRLLAEDCAS